MPELDDHWITLKHLRFAFSLFTKIQWLLVTYELYADVNIEQMMEFTKFLTNFLIYTGVPHNDWPLRNMEVQLLCDAPTGDYVPPTVLDKNIPNRDDETHIWYGRFFNWYFFRSVVHDYLAQNQNLRKKADEVDDLLVQMELQEKQQSNYHAYGWFTKCPGQYTCLLR